jgi:hypothetical protein
MHQHTLPTNGKVTITLKEAVEVTGIPTWTLRRHIYERKLAGIRPGGSRGNILIIPTSTRISYAIASPRSGKAKPTHPSKLTGGVGMTPAPAVLLDLI